MGVFINAELRQKAEAKPGTFEEKLAVYLEAAGWRPEYAVPCDPGEGNCRHLFPNQQAAEAYARDHNVDVLEERLVTGWGALALSA